ncbi:MAG: ComF family protein [Myxococcota bacterium]
MKRLLARTWASLRPRPGDLAALFPRACAGCGGRTPAEHAVVCADCQRGVPWIATSVCPHCQAHEGRGDACGTRPTGDPLGGAIAAAWWEPPVSDWIAAFKYPARGWRGLDPKPEAATRWLIEAAVARTRGAPDLVVPVPLHPRRVRERGFQPAGLLAQHVARHLGVPVSVDALVRTRATPSQTGMSAAARRRNLAGAIASRRALSGTLWIVDDVVTTGATLRETARVARAAGAERVVGVCAARTAARAD